KVVMNVYNTHGKQSISVRCLILTISDTRTSQTDKSGKLIQSLLRENQHKIVDRVVVADDAAQIRQHVLDGCLRPDVDVILTTGGTGISKRDVTIETIENLLDKEITGFGELFRMLSYTEDIGSAAMMSRALAGTHKHKAIF